MMNNLYFKNVTEIGDLFLDNVLYEFEGEPILFLCLDKYNQIYFCLCSDFRYEQKWIVAKCDIDILELLVEKKIDILSLFMASKNLFIIKMDLQGNEASSKINTEEVNELDLPEKGVYLKGNKDDLKKYLRSLATKTKENVNPKKSKDNELLFQYVEIMNVPLRILSKRYSKMNSTVFFEDLKGFLQECVKIDYSTCKEEKYSEERSSQKIRIEMLTA